jgi:hypothetical protein
MSDNLIVQFKTAVTVTVFESVVYSHNAPSVYENAYEGNAKFLQAFAKVSKEGYRSFFTIWLTTKSEATGNTYRQKLSVYDFIKFVAFELQSGVLESFSQSMFKHDKGFENDASDIVADNTKEVYASFEAGTHYWKVMMAEQQDKVMKRGEVASTVAEPFDTEVSENK